MIGRCPALYNSSKRPKEAIEKHLGFSSFVAFYVLLAKLNKRRDRFRSGGHKNLAIKDPSSAQVGTFLVGAFNHTGQTQDPPLQLLQ